MSIRQYIYDYGYEADLQIAASLPKHKRLEVRVRIRQDGSTDMYYKVWYKNDLILMSGNPIVAAETYDNL